METNTNLPNDNQDSIKLLFKLLSESKIELEKYAGTVCRWERVKR